MPNSLPQFDDNGPWFVRVIHNKVAVGIYTCTEYELADLIDETCEPDACEYKKLDSGGFVFSGEPVLHIIDKDGESQGIEGFYFTESWRPIYEDEGAWSRIDALLFDNDE